MNTLLETPPPYSLRNGLVASWPLASADAVAVQPGLWTPSAPTASVLNLTNNNTVTRAAGPSADLPDAAAFVSASSQYLSRADHALLSLGGGGDWEVTAWVWLTDTPNAVRSVAAHYETTGNQRGWWLLFTANTSVPVLRASADGSSSVVDATMGGGIGTQTWAFVTGYFDSHRQRLGITVNAGSPTEATIAAVHDSTGALTVGARAGGADFMNGRIAQLTMHRCVLTRDERAWLWSRGLGRDLRRAA